MTPSVLSLAAESYLEAGLCALPAVRNGDVKRPAVSSWKAYQDHRPTFDEIRQSFDEPNPTNSMCVVCGAVSANLEMIDFDLAGEAFEPWKEKVNAKSPGLFDRLVIETSPSGGFHVVYRCDCVVSGNMKLAQRRIECDDAEQLVVASKSYMPRQDADGKWRILVTMIETRGEGGLFLCAPSPGYEIIQGDLRQPPVLTTEERTALLECAWSLDENKQELADGLNVDTGINPSVSTIAPSDPLKPGDDFNSRGDVREILIAAGWKPSRTTADGNEHWTRPGKQSGTSATLKFQDGIFLFFVHSTNAPPFDAGKAYSPFAVCALLEHNGDYTAAASALAAKGYAQTPDTMTNAALAAFTANSPQSASSGDTAPSPIGPEPQIVFVGELVKQHPKLRPPVVHGLLREGETMNIIGAAKSGKSWLSLDLAIAVACGEPWLQRYDTVPGKVLIVDNELHKETSAHRTPLVANARNVSMRQIAQRVAIDNMRGRLQDCDIHAMVHYFNKIEPGQFKLIILDAFYRFLPANVSENDNAAMRNAFNTIDNIAKRLECCIVLIHHASKGNQAGKGITDVGAGAGAQSRAADSHMILRQHDEDDVFVLEAVARSWEPIKPVCMRWKFPVWTIDESLDPADLRIGKKKRKDCDDESVHEPAWNVERFVDEFMKPDDAITMAELRERTEHEIGLSWRRAKDLVEIAERKELLDRVKLPGRGGPVGFILHVERGQI